MYHPEEVGHDCEKSLLETDSDCDLKIGGVENPHCVGHVGMICRTCGKNEMVTSNQIRSVDETSLRNTPEKHDSQERWCSI